MIQISFAISVEILLQNLNIKTRQDFLKTFTMRTLLGLGTRTKHGLHTKLAVAALSRCDDGATENRSR